MSIFTDHVSVTDDILLKYYNIWEGYGSMHPKWNDKNVPAEIIDKGSFYTEDACWIEWAACAKERIIRDYKIELKNFSKQTYLHNFKKEVQQGNFETRSYNGVTYYRWEDVRKFHHMHDIMSVWRYCKRNRIHWDGPLK